MNSMTEEREEDELEWEGSVLDYASPYRTKDKKAIDAYPINSALKSLREKRRSLPVSMNDDNCNKL